MVVRQTTNPGGGDSGEVTAEWADYTPALTQGVAVTYTGTCRYVRIGNVVHAWGNITTTSAGTSGQGITLELPVAAIVGFSPTPLGVGNILDVGVTNYNVIAINDGSGIVFYRSDAATDARMGVSPSFALAANDKIHWNITYEVAAA